MRGFVICPPHHIIYGDEMGGGGRMEGTHRTQSRDQKCIQDFGRNILREETTW